MRIRSLALPILMGFSLVSLTTPCGANEPDLDTRPWPLGVEVAFPNLTWTGWEPEVDGIATPIRPILLTHAGDGSNRVFVPTQRGVIHVFPNDSGATATEVFLDIRDKVSYSDKTNEEGFLGLAFHPNYRENGRFFVYYTNTASKHQNVIASYRVDPDNPNRADPASEEILLVLDKPFWNHDGGTILFGPDGYLYAAVGDGGLANDPFGNGQKLSTLLGKILRIDVDRPSADKPYGIPADNPFVNEPNARPEIYAYGLRNVWRMAFDSETGKLWAADVGQDTWEEVNIIVKGGNYGWNLREGMHPFAKSKSPAEARPDLIEPIWEYHHDIGKSITGGFVYRGQSIPELVGSYLYADYIAGKLWALIYDEEAGRVVANREIPLPASIPVLSFGSDQRGEAYFMTYSLDGRGIYRLVGTSAQSR